MAEDDVPLYVFIGCVYFCLQVTRAQDAANALNIAQQHAQPHYGPDYSSFGSFAVLLGLNEIKTNGPLVDGVGEVEVHDGKEQFLLRQRIEVGFVVYLVLDYLGDDGVSLSDCVV